LSQALPPGFGDWSGDSKYELRGTLGAGAMGVVLDGFDRAIERRVAIKLVRKPAPDDVEAVEAAARFKREAQAAGRLSHPGIVAVYDYGENEDTAWIVMERVDGGTLKAVLDRNERLPVRETARIMGQVLNALAYAHARGVIHRDIKPANVMLTSEGDAKLADFGIARLENSAMTQVGTLMGTPSYMAPEQLRGEALDARADIWAAGVMLYQLLTGEKPFPGGFSAVMHKVLNTEPVPPSALSATSPPALDAVVMRALAKRPDDRWPDARAFAAAIEAAIAAPAAAPVQVAAPAEDATFVSSAMPRPAATSPAPAPATPSAPAPSSGRGWVLPAAGVGAVAIGAAAFLLWPRETAPPTPAPPAPILSAQAPPTSLPPPAPSLSVETPDARQQPAPPASPANTPAPAPEPPAAAPPSAAVPTPPSAPVSAPSPAAVPAPPSAPATVATEPLPAGPGPVLAPAPQPSAPRAPAVLTEPVPPVRPAPNPAPAQPPALQVEPAPPAPAQQTAQAQSTQPPAPQTPPAATTTPASPATQLALAPLPRPDWRAIAASAVATAPCGLLSSRVEDAGFRLQGVLPRREAEALRRDLAGRNLPAGAARLDLGTFDAPLCPLVAALRPALAAPGDAPEITLDGAMPLRKGQLLRFSVRMPAWADHLHVAYATLGGPVARLEPGAPQAPGARVRLGDPRPGFQGWEIDEPYGTDLLLVVASEGPLFAPGAAVVEEQDAYAKGFAAALQAARAAGRRVAMRPLVVDTVER
jgi:serine/threonine-protein kinase